MTANRPVPQLVEHLFRHAFGRIVAALVRVFGPDQLQACEDVVQEALLRALQNWPFQGVPDQPEGWLLQVAKNLALDRVRHQRMAARREQDLVAWAQRAAPTGPPPDEVADDTLRMMFVCCHPSLSFEARVALTLKTLCGFAVPEIARAFLAKEATIAQRLVRAKEQLRQERVDFVLPPPRQLAARLHDVLAVLYLLFNEGYAATSGDDAVRRELVHEAVRLTRLLAADPVLGVPGVHALLALMLLQGARLPARADASGDLLTLAQQDRSRWDAGWVHEGLQRLAQAMTGSELTRYHVEAAIASCHAVAPDYAATDWAAILRHYERLRVLAPSAVVELNRAVAVAKVEGARAGLAALRAAGLEVALAGYALLPATEGMLRWQLGELAVAATCFAAALELPGSEPEKSLLRARLTACQRGDAAPRW